MKIKQVVDALEHCAPLPLQEGYDNAGLQVGLTETVEMSGALLCLDVTEAVVDEAIRKGCNLIVSHHPLIFRKLARISDENYVQRTVRKAIKNDITIVAMHTNMDAAAGGVNFKIAEKLGLRNVQFFAGEKEVDGVKGGEGVIGEVAEDLAADDLVLMLKERFGVECVQCNQLLRRPNQEGGTLRWSRCFLARTQPSRQVPMLHHGRDELSRVFSATSRRFRSASSATIRVSSLRAKSSAASSRRISLMPNAASRR